MEREINKQQNIGFSVTTIRSFPTIRRRTCGSVVGLLQARNEKKSQDVFGEIRL